MTSFGRQFDFHDVMSFITNGIVTLTIDGVTSILQLFDGQIIRKNMRFSLNKGCGKF